MPIINSNPDESICGTKPAGIITCIQQINKECVRQLNAEVPATLSKTPSFFFV